MPNARGLAWDSSGQRLAISAGLSVRVAQLAGGAVREAQTAGAGMALAFSPDGQELAVVGKWIEFLSLPELRQKRMRLTAPMVGDDAPQVLDVRYAPDGRSLGVLFAGGVAFMDLQTHQLQATLLRELAPIGLRYAPDGRVAVFGRGALYIGPASLADLQTAARTTSGTLWDVEFRRDGSLLFLGDAGEADLQSLLE
jgi:WD40 repeat protein